MWNRQDKSTIFNLSLGILSKNFSKKKTYLRSKASYLLSAAYLRRLLVNLNIISPRLIVQGIPIYLKDIIKVILTPTNVLYKDPFNYSKLDKEDIINEKKNNPTLFFNYVIFFGNKPYGIVKEKKRGRLKRKIMKRVIINNKLID